MAFQIVSRDLYGLLGNALYRYIGGTFYWYKVLRFIYVLEEVYFRRPCSNNIHLSLDARLPKSLCLPLSMRNQTFSKVSSEEFDASVHQSTNVT